MCTLGSPADDLHIDTLAREFGSDGEVPRSTTTWDAHSLITNWLITTLSLVFQHFAFAVECPYAPTSRARLSSC